MLNNLNNADGKYNLNFKDISVDLKSEDKFKFDQFLKDLKQQQEEYERICEFLHKRYVEALEKWGLLMCSIGKLSEHLKSLYVLKREVEMLKKGRGKIVEAVEATLGHSLESITSIGDKDFSVKNKTDEEITTSLLDSMSEKQILRYIKKNMKKIIRLELQNFKDKNKNISNCKDDENLGGKSEKYINSKFKVKKDDFGMEQTDFIHIEGEKGDEFKEIKQERLNKVSELLDALEKNLNIKQFNFENKKFEDLDFSLLDVDLFDKEQKLEFKRNDFKLDVRYADFIERKLLNFKNLKVEDLSIEDVVLNVSPALENLQKAYTKLEECKKNDLGRALKEIRNSIGNSMKYIYKRRRPKFNKKLHYVIDPENLNINKNSEEKNYVEDEIKENGDEEQIIEGVKIYENGNENYKKLKNNNEIKEIY